MKALIPKFLYTSYRKEPISSFILIMGVIDGILGGFSERWTLLSFGLLLLITSAVVRWLQIQKTEKINSVFQQTPRRYLPPSTSSNPLPTLKSRR